MANSLIFDWGGVITKKRLLSGFYSLLSAKFGVESSTLRKTYLEIGFLYETSQWDAERFFTEYAKRAGITAPWGELKEIFVHSFENDGQMLEFLARLQPNNSLYLLSDNYKEIKELIEPELKKIFKKRFYSCDYGMTKADPAFFTLAASEIGALPSECILIDDMEQNAATAKKLGINTIIYTDIASLKSTLQSFGACP